MNKLKKKPKMKRHRTKTTTGDVLRIGKESTDTEIDNMLIKREKSSPCFEN